MFWGVHPPRSFPLSLLGLANFNPYSPLPRPSGGVFPLSSSRFFSFWKPCAFAHSLSWSSSGWYEDLSFFGLGQRQDRCRFPTSPCPPLGEAQFTPRPPPTFSLDCRWVTCDVVCLNALPTRAFWRAPGNPRCRSEGERDPNPFFFTFRFSARSSRVLWNLAFSFFSLFA